MEKLKKNKFHRIEKDKESVSALYTTNTVTRNYYGTHRSEELCIGSFSRSEWRIVNVRGAIHFFVQNLLWIVGLMGIGLLIFMFTITESMGTTLIVGLLGCALILVAILDLINRVENYRLMGEVILDKLRLIPQAPDSEIEVRDYMNVDREMLISHLKNSSKEDFVNLVESFDKWDKTHKTYKELMNNIQDSRSYDDADVYEFAMEKSKDLYKTKMDHSKEAKKLAKEIQKGVHHSKLIQSLHKTEQILAG